MSDYWDRKNNGNRDLMPTLDDDHKTQIALGTEMNELQRQAEGALNMVDDVVLKNYLTILPQLPLVKPASLQDTKEV